MIPDIAAFYVLCKSQKAEDGFMLERMEFQDNLNIKVCNAAEMKKLIKASGATFEHWCMISAHQIHDFFNADGKLDNEIRNDLYLAALWVNHKTKDVYIYIPSNPAEMCGNFGRRMGTHNFRVEGINMSPYTEKQN